MGGFRSFLILLFFMSFVGLSSARAQNVSDIHQYPNPQQVEVVKVKAHISRVNHGLLRTDYPFMKGWSDAQVESWISENLNIMTKSQAQQSEANSAMDYQNFEIVPKGHSGAKQPYVCGVYRPTGYGRALIVEVYDPKSNGLFYFDGKGLGAEHPLPQPHRTGLASFGEANREITISTMINRVLEYEHSRFSAIQSYFQFQYEFEMQEQMPGHRIVSNRAGAVFRQNHLRQRKIVAGEEDFLGGADPKISLEVEKVLRKYGITSAGASFDDDHEVSNFLDVTNVQITADGNKLYDFGGYLVEREFKLPLIEWDSLVDYLVEHPGNARDLQSRLEQGDAKLTAILLARPGQSDFVQPDPNLRVPFDFFGYGISNIRSVRYDGPWIFAHDLDGGAKHQGLGEIPRSWVEKHGQDVLERLAHLSVSPVKSCSMVFATP